MLTSARNYYQRQQRITALGLRAARRAASRGPLAVAAALGAYQATAAVLAASAVSEMLAEQDIEDAPEGRLNPQAFVTGVPAVELIRNTGSSTAFDRLAATLVQDAGRSAMGVATASRPTLEGHVRYLNPPSCSRCAVLAGRFYRWSDGFQRHPLCDCVMLPTNQAPAADLITNPRDAFERGQIRGMSKADAEAIRDGADIGQVVNVRRSEAGLRLGSAVIERGGRLTPEGVYRVASDRTEAISLLRRHGYIT